MLSIYGVAHDQVWYERSPFYNSNFSIPNRSASLFERVFLEKVCSKMISIQGYKHFRRERHSVTSAIGLFNSFPPPKLGDKLSDQPAGPLGTKPPVGALFAATNIPKYFKIDL